MSKEEKMLRKTGKARMGFKEAAIQLRAYIALIALVVVFSILSPNFLSSQNLITISKHVAINAIIAVGMTFVVLTGGIDLSVGAIAGLSGMIAGGLIYEGLVLNLFGITIYYHVVVVIIISIIIGVLVGFLNGILITRFNVAPFIATLGTMYVCRGSAMLRSNGKTFPNLQGKPELGNTGFPFLGAGRIIGVPISVWLMIILVIIGVYLSKKTPFGRYVFAVGGNEEAARLSGIRVKKIKTLVYMISGGCAALVGLIISSELVAAHPATGEAYEMNAIAATVLGGTSLAGGRGSISGAILGAFVIGVLNDGMVMVGVSSFWQTVIKGVVIVAAVIFDQLQSRSKGLRATTK